MNMSQIQKATEMLWRARQTGQPMDCLPEDYRPQSPQEGHAIQKALAAQMGRELLGWKLAATNESAQAFLRVDGPLTGRLIDGTCARSPHTMSLEGIHMRVAEVEMAFRMERSLAPREGEYLVEDVMAHVGALYPAIEIPDSRFVDFTNAGAPQLIADNSCAAFFVLGEEVRSDWRKADLSAHSVSVRLNGELAGTGCGRNVLGDPRIAMAWLANDLARRGDCLAEGQVVITGTIIKPVAITPGDHVVGDLGEFGTVEVTLSSGNT